MKTKLRKEFEEFKKKTLIDIWKLTHPPVFKYGDSVFWSYDVSCVGTYRGEREIQPYYDSFRRIVYFEFNNVIQEVSEDDLELK